jgi:type IV pilus assembly protein PilE
MFKKIQGFTLIELMVAVAIIGILAAIAVPSYQDSVTKSRRADVKGAMLGLANAMERHFTENNTYKEAAGTSATPTDTGVPYIYTVDTGTAKYYDITINAADDTTYTLWAAPKGAQSHDKCGTFKLTNTGVKSFTGTGVTSTDCW